MRNAPGAVGRATFYGLSCCPSCYGWSYNPCCFCGHDRGIGKTSRELCGSPPPYKRQLENE